MDLCIFCEYIAGRLPWYPVRECDLGVVFLNLRQRSEGALLVAPRRHAGWITDLTMPELRELLSLTRDASALLFRAFVPDGLHTWCNSGEASGQSEPHFHFQIVPRYSGRPYSFDSSRALSNTPNAVLSETLGRLKAHL
jgi:histidine triad (HIT) family protein